MNNTIKRVVSGTLSCILLASMMTTALASEDASSTIILHSDNEQFQEAFGTSASSQGRSASNTYNNAVYTYSVELENDTHGMANVDFVLHIGNEVYPIHTEGEVQRMVLNDDYTLIKGTLTGTVDINNYNYDVNLGFNQLEGESDISAGVVLIPEDFDENEDAEQILLSFGTPVMSSDIAQAYSKYLDGRERPLFEDGVTSEEVLRSTSASTTLSGTATGKFRSDNSGGGYTAPTSRRASYLEVRKDNANKRFVLRLQSYTGNIYNSDFKNATLYNTYIDAYQIGLKRIGSNTSISGVEGVNFNYTGQSNASLYKVFSPLLGTLAGSYSIAINTLGSLLKDTSGKVTVNAYGNESVIHVKLALDSNINFNSSSKAVPGAFNILTNGLTGNYTAYADLTYTVDCDAASFPIRATRASVDVTI